MSEYVELVCHNNETVPDYISKNPGVKYLYVTSMMDSSFCIKDHKNVTALIISNSKTDVTVANMPNLGYLYIYCSGSVSITLTNMPNLTMVHLYSDFPNPDQKMIRGHFGDSRYSDFTMHKHPERRLDYIRRHRNDRLDDPESPGSLSYYLLWGDFADLQKNIVAFRKRFSL